MPDTSIQKVSYFEPATIPADVAENSLEILRHAKLKSFTAGGAVTAGDSVSLDGSYATGAFLAQVLGRFTRVVQAPASGASTAVSNGVVGVALETGTSGSDFRVVVAGPCKANVGTVAALDSLCVANTAGRAIKFIITTQTGATDGPFAVALTADAEDALDANEGIIFVYPRSL